MPKIDQILRAIAGEPWAIVPEKLEAIAEFLALRMEGQRLNAEEVEARIGPPRLERPSGPGHIAVLPLYGIIAHRAHMVRNTSGPGGTSTEQFGDTFQQVLSNPDVEAILLDVDSPGGTVAGVDELSRQIFEARGRKRIVASVNALAASAAYYIASAADEIVVTPSGEVGSIGVYMLHQTAPFKLADAAGITSTIVKAGRFKAEGHPWMPLDDEARAAMQERVDHFYGLFVDAVARNRGVSTAKVLGGFGEGRTVTAARALELGMADRVATFEQTLADLGAGSRPDSDRRRRAATARQRLALDAADILS